MVFAGTPDCSATVPMFIALVLLSIALRPPYEAPRRHLRCSGSAFAAGLSALRIIALQCSIMALIWLVMPIMSPDPPRIMVQLSGDLSDCACNVVPPGNAASAPPVINNIVQLLVTMSSFRLPSQSPCAG